jgi:hypothetical protein
MAKSRKNSPVKKRVGRRMSMKEVRAVHLRLARFTANRAPIAPGDGRCVRQTSVYTATTDEITACRCVRKENHESPHRFRHPSGLVSEVKFKQKS